jgi:Fe-S oxidoreductase
MVTVLSQPGSEISKAFLDGLLTDQNGQRFKTCIQCGTCAGICPYGMWMDYPPRKLIYALRESEFDQVLESEKAWMCVSCYACSEFCPQQIPLTQVLMTRLKEELLIAGKVPPELQEALENSQRYGNPLGESPRKRGDWAKDLQPEVPILAKENRSVDVLWFVGDYASYHPAVQPVSRALYKVLKLLGIEVGILGPEEVSDGDSQRLAGEIGLFEMLAEKNSKAFDKYEFSQIMTTDPHAYNALKNEYPKLGFDFPVVHYTQFLVGKLDELAPHLKNEINAIVAFHDPCYLGRVNGIYNEPRKLIEAIPGVHLVEMSHSRSNSLCCGGGGGGMWLDGFQWEIAETRTTEWRVQEMVAAKPLSDFVSVLRVEKTGRQKKNGHTELPCEHILAVACPYEKPRFTDALKVVDSDEDICVMDIAEMLAQSIGM